MSSVKPFADKQKPILIPIVNGTPVPSGLFGVKKKRCLAGVRRV